MKKLKFLLIPLISLLFVINVNATEMSSKYSVPSYTSEQIEQINSFKNSSKYSQIIEYVQNNMTNYFVPSKQQYYNFTDNYMLIFRFDTLLTNSLRVSFFKNFEYIPYNVYYSNYSDYGGYSIFLNASGGLGAYFDFNFTNDVLTSVSLYSTGNDTMYFTNILDENNENFISYPNNKFIDTTFFDSTNQTVSFGYDEGRFTVNVPIKLDDTIYTPPTSFSGQDFLDTLQLSLNPPILEPTYSYTSTILDNGNVKLDFTFTNYTDTSGYAFEIENYVSNEEYGIENTYSSIFPKQIPFGSTYSIELAYDSLLYVTLAKYEQVEQTTLYFREEIYTNMIDIDNIVFENEQDPYFVIYRQTKNLIEGSFANTNSNNTCWYRYSTSQNEDFVPCDEMLGLSFYDNGYVEVLIKKGTTTIYSRKINYLGSSSNEPYIIYNITKQDFYSVVNWYIENEYSNMTYRYSIDNGQNFTSWINYSNNQNTINVFDNSTIIIEIANNNQSTIYDSKSIVVVNNISEIKNINNTTINFLDKFRSIFSVNTNILSNINNFYDNIKSSKIYLLIFIPFLASLIGAIIYLIRRK